MDDLFLKVRTIAEKSFGGHFTIFKFTTHYKGMFGTVDVDSMTGRDQIRSLPGFLTMQDLLMWMIKQPEGSEHFNVDRIVKGVILKQYAETLNKNENY